MIWQHPPQGRVWAAALLAGWLLCACNPALDWRELSWPAGGFSVLLPGRPDEAQRDLMVGATALHMHLLTVHAQGQIYAVGHADLPANLGAQARTQLLVDAQAGLARNVQADAGPLPAPPAAAPMAGLDCRDFSLNGHASEHPVEVFGRVCTSNQRFYELLVVGAGAAEDRLLFLGSFRML